VEQKNWARVRELAGYLRYDTAAELELLNQIWGLDAVNYLLPQQKLLAKTRHGAKVRPTRPRPLRTDMPKRTPTPIERQ
jgi:hypothetical protein